MENKNQDDRNVEEIGTIELLPIGNLHVLTGLFVLGMLLNGYVEEWGAWLNAVFAALAYHLGNKMSIRYVMMWRIIRSDKTDPGYATAINENKTLRSVGYGLVVIAMPLISYISGFNADITICFSCMAGISLLFLWIVLNNWSALTSMYLQKCKDASEIRHHKTK